MNIYVRLSEINHTKKATNVSYSSYVESKNSDLIELRQYGMYRAEESREERGW
jgi:hypothetical protein